MADPSPPPLIDMVRRLRGLPQSPVNYFSFKRQSIVMYGF